MEVRQATTNDADDIREVARASLEASYSHFLDEDTIDSALAEWYGSGSLETEMNREDSLFLVAEDDDEVVGFVQSAIVGDDGAVGEVLWIHVSPDHRGREIGATLLEGAEAELVDRGAIRLRGLVLAENETGNEFYENHGYAEAGDRDVDVGGETHAERTWKRDPESVGVDAVTVEEHSLPDGETGYVMYAEAQRGADAPFFKTYLDEAGERHHGWYCDNCGSFDVAADTMGRLECNECGNRTKATRWDAAYL